MALPKTDSALKIPAALRANMEAEERLEQQEVAVEPKKPVKKKRTLKAVAPRRSTQLTFSPISEDLAERFEEFYLDLRRQDKRVRRYMIIEALFEMLEDDEVVEMVYRGVGERLR